MGCGLSTRLNPDDDVTLAYGRMSDYHITYINSPATKNGVNSIRRSQKSLSSSSSSSQGKNEKHVVEGEEKEEGGYDNEFIIFPRSPSFREYCIASMNQSLSDNGSVFSIKNNGGKDSTYKHRDDDKELRKKKERRIIGLRNVMLIKEMLRRKRNVVNIGCYTSLAPHDEKNVQ